MARPLSPALDAVQRLGQTRRPAFVIEIYDLRSTSGEVTPTRINDVVLSNLGLGAIPTIVGPRDFTDDVEFVDVNETAGDYVDNGIAASQITFQVADPIGELDPVTNAPTSLDPEALGRWLRQGNVVVIREGDYAVDPSEWVVTFTGTLVGQPGQDRNRTTGASRLFCKALSREQDYVSLTSTTISYPQNTTFQSMAEDIAEVDLGLSVDEINLPTFSTASTAFATTQFVGESPLVSIAKIMFLDGFLPRFGGDGRLQVSFGSISKSPTRFYTESALIRSITRPFLAESAVNEVEIVGLNSEMSQVVQAAQVLARASITTGFFSKDAKIPVRWSEDGTLQAFNVFMQVDASVGDALFSFGGESFTNFPSGIDGGSVSGQIDVDGAYNPALVIIVLAVLVAAHFIPDGASIGSTIPIGRLVEGALTKIAMSILGSQARGQYRIMGSPYEYVFQELRAVVRKEGIRSEDRRSITIENHLLNTQADCDTVAERVFRRERAKQNRRSIEMLHDLILEPDDVIEVGSGLTARRYLISSISRRLTRDGQHLARLEAFEVTAGVLP